jgi:hypothetical protein
VRAGAIERETSEMQRCTRVSHTVSLSRSLSFSDKLSLFLSLSLSLRRSPLTHADMDSDEEPSFQRGS